MPILRRVAIELENAARGGLSRGGNRQSQYCHKRDNRKQKQFPKSCSITHAILLQIQISGLLHLANNRWYRPNVLKRFGRSRHTSHLGSCADSQASARELTQYESRGR